MTSGGRERRTNWESVTLIRIYLNITWTQQAIFLRFAPGTQQVLYVTNHHKIVGIQQVLKLKNVT